MSVAEEYELSQLEVAARAEALRAFGTLCLHGALARLPQRQLCMLLAQDELRSDDESRVFEAVVSWHAAQQVRVEGGGVGGEEGGG